MSHFILMNRFFCLGGFCLAISMPVHNFLKRAKSNWTSAFRLIYLTDLKNRVFFFQMAHLCFSFLSSFQFDFFMATLRDYRRKGGQKGDSEWRRYAFWMIHMWNELVEFFGCAFLDMGDGLHSKRETENGCALAFIFQKWKQNQTTTTTTTNTTAHFRGNISPRVENARSSFGVSGSSDTGEKSNIGQTAMANWCVYIYIYILYYIYKECGRLSAILTGCVLSLCVLAESFSHWLNSLFLSSRSKVLITTFDVSCSYVTFPIFCVCVCFCLSKCLSVYRGRRIRD